MPAAQKPALPLLLLLLLIVAGLVAATPLSAVAPGCDAATLWRSVVVTGDRMLSFLFRYEAVTGIARTVDYYRFACAAGANVSFFSSPNVSACDYFNDALCTAAIVDGLPSAILQVRDALLRRKHTFNSGESGCPDPFQVPVYDEYLGNVQCKCIANWKCTASSTGGVGTSAFVGGGGGSVAVSSTPSTTDDNTNFITAMIWIVFAAVAAAFLGGVALVGVQVCTGERRPRRLPPPPPGR